MWLITQSAIIPSRLCCTHNKNGNFIPAARVHPIVTRQSDGVIMHQRPPVGVAPSKTDREAHLL